MEEKDSGYMYRKILIANRRYFESSGPERYMLSVSNILRKNGYEAIPFSVKRSGNIPTRFDKYFVRPPYGEKVLYFDDANVSSIHRLRIFFNCIYSFEARSKMKRILREEAVDIVYLLGIVNDISPSIIHACHAANVPVVMRLSDYNILCGNYLFLRDNELCTLCVTRGVWQCTKYKCVKAKMLPSLTRSISLYVHRLLNIYDGVDYFVCPSRFMMRSMIEAGFPSEKMCLIHSFLDPHDYVPYYGNEGYILYFGRISHEKGIDYLVRALGRLDNPPPLYLVGEPSAETYLDSLKKQIAQLGLDSVKILGFKKGDKLKRLIHGAKFVVVPSICADNSPMSTIEALASGKPVIASDIGGIPDQVTEQCGFLVPPKDEKILADKIKVLWDNDDLVRTMGVQARKHFDVQFSLQTHFKQLIDVFNNAYMQRGHK